MLIIPHTPRAGERSRACSTFCHALTYLLTCTSSSIKSEKEKCKINQSGGNITSPIPQLTCQPQPPGWYLLANHFPVMTSAKDVMGVTLVPFFFPDTVTLFWGFQYFFCWTIATLTVDCSVQIMNPKSLRLLLLFFSISDFLM